MTTPAKLTPLTDPDNVAWVVEEPPPAEVVSAARHTKMAAYSALVAAISLKKKFDESKVKRGKGGKFAKKADSSSPPSDPAKKTAAAPPTPGKKMTNKVVYGKHANGTIIETSDGQHRMVFNAAGNNWTFQERTPDGGWKVIDVLGKGASYKKAQELSDEWGAPHDGTAAELTPVPGVTPSGSFAPGWDVISDPSLTNFKKLQILTAFETSNPSPEMHRGLMAKNIANIAQTYGVEPETVLALINQKRGDTAFSDAMQEHLKGDPFPDPVYPSSAKKAAAMKKATAKKVVAPTPAVAPSPAPTTPTPSPSPVSGPTYTAATNPQALALSGQPFELSELQAQATDSLEIEMLRQQMMHMAKNNEPFDEINKISDKYIAARKKYSETYGVSWSENHHKALSNLYQDKLINGASSASPADGTPISGAPSDVVVGAQVKLTSGFIGTVIGPGTTATGQPGVQVKLSDGSVVTKPVASAKKLSATEETAIAALPPNGSVLYHKTLGELTYVGGPYVDAVGTTVVKVMKSDGSSTTLALSSVSVTPIAPPPPTAAGLSVGMTVDSPAGPGTIVDISPSGKKLEIQLPDGTKAFVDSADTMEIPPSAVPSAPPAPSAATSTGLPALSLGTHVSTPHGDGVLTGGPTTSPGGTFYAVKLTNGSQVHVFDTDVAKITPSAPPPAPPTPASNPGVTYDANGVPLLTPDQQYKLQSQFQNAGVNWYNPSEKLFDAAYAASQATGLSIEDVLKYADANFHNSAKDGGKPIQTKIVKWAKSSKGKAHIQATMGTSAAAPVPPAPAPTPSPSGTPTLSPTTPPATPASGAALPGTPADISGIPKVKQTAAFTQFTAGYTALTTDSGILAQKAVDVAKNTGLTPEQVLAIVDAKKAEQAGVSNGSLFANKVLGHQNGEAWPTPTPPPTPGSGATGTLGTTSYSQAPAFPVSSGFTTVTPTDATQLQANMVASSSPISAGQRASLKYYTSNNYTKINSCLRFGTGCTPAVKKHITLATAGMRPTTQNITTFRGTSLKAFGANNIAELEQMVGKTITEPGFSSTSIAPGSAFGGQVAMQIDIPAGTMGSYVGNISHYKSEKEFLLPPGMKFRIVEVKPASGGKKAFVHVEVVPA